MTNITESFDLPDIISYVYENYAAMLYGIALQFLPDEKIAEEILIAAFVKIHRNNSIQIHQRFLCMDLIRLIIEVAHEHKDISELNKNSFSLNKQKNTVVLNELLCQQMSLEAFCSKNKLTRAQVAKKLRTEFLWLRNKDLRPNIV